MGHDVSPVIFSIARVFLRADLQNAPAPALSRKFESDKSEREILVIDKAGKVPLENRGLLHSGYRHCTAINTSRREAYRAP
jgi:hypothetical protein